LSRVSGSRPKENLPRPDAPAEIRRLVLQPRRIAFEGIAPHPMQGLDKSCQISPGNPFKCFCAGLATIKVQVMEELLEARVVAPLDRGASPSIAATSSSVGVSTGMLWKYQHSASATISDLLRLRLV
jgi:hypothetical protein